MSKVIPDELTQALGLTGDLDISRLAGHANDNYLVTTKNRKIVVKCLGEHTPEKEQLEGEYRQFLNNSGLPVAPFLTFTNGNFVFSQDNKHYVALDYIEGLEARDKVSQIISPLATIVGKLHLLSYDSMPKRVNWLDGKFSERVTKELGLGQELAQELAREAATFSDFWNNDIPKGIVHGDLHGGNIIVNDKDEIATIIDWEEAGIVPIVLDIAGMVQSLTQGDDGFDLDNYNEFFLAYQSIRPLTDREKELFPEAIRYLSFITYTWALWKYTIGNMGFERLTYFKKKYYTTVDVPVI